MQSAGMSIRDYAAHRRARGLPGGSKAAVQKAILAGRISRTGSLKIDPEVADREWAENSNPAQLRPGSLVPASGHDPAPPPATKSRGPARGGHPPRSPEDEGHADSDAQSFARSRAIREDYNARIARLEYEEAAGNLVARGAVGREQFRLARDTRNNVLAVPSRVDALLAATSDPAEVRRILTEDLIRALDGVAGE